MGEKTFAAALTLVGKPGGLPAHERSTDHRTVAGNKDRTFAACGKDSLQRGRPGLQVGVLVNTRVVRFLDEVAAEHHWSIRPGDDRDEVVVCVPTTRVADSHLRATEPDHRLGNKIVGRCKRRDSTVHIVGIGAVALCVCPQVLTLRRHRRNHLG